MTPLGYGVPLTRRFLGQVPIVPCDHEGMQYRLLGATGVQCSILGLGGESALYRRSDAAVRIITRALELGVNYFDTAPLYQDSELNYGEVTPYARNRMFLATKIEARDRDGAWRQFENSLGRLRTGYVDLLQIHHLDDHAEVDAVAASRWRSCDG